MKIVASEALKTGKANQFSRYGSGENCARERLSNVHVPQSKLEFKLDESSKVFAIGSCFARNVEESLNSAGINVVSLNFEFPYTPDSARKNGIVNKYNPGVIKQSIFSAFSLSDYDERRLFKVGDDSFIDSFLKGGESPVGLRLAKEGITAEKAYFEQLKLCDTVFITLGMIECWYDELLQCYLNQPPHPKAIRNDPERYFFKRMTLEEVLVEMQSSIDVLVQNGIKNIVFTTSPVALNRTFTDKDVIVANCYSKSVLRVACEILAESNCNVNYFPSYETIIYGDRNITFQNDLIHASDYAVSNVIAKFVERSTMLEVDKPAASIEQASEENNELYKLRKQLDKYKNLLIANNIEIK